MNDLYIAEIYRLGVIFLQLIVRVCLHSLLHCESQKKLYRVRYALRSFKVIQGHRIWYQSKAHMRIPIILVLDILDIMRSTNCYE